MPSSYYQRHSWPTLIPVACAILRCGLIEFCKKFTSVSCPISFYLTMYMCTCVSNGHGHGHVYLTNFNLYSHALRKFGSVKSWNMRCWQIQFRDLMDRYVQPNAYIYMYAYMYMYMYVYMYVVTHTTAKLLQGSHFLDLNYSLDRLQFFESANACIYMYMQGLFQRGKGFAVYVCVCLSGCVMLRFRCLVALSWFVYMWYIAQPAELPR